MQYKGPQKKDALDAPTASEYKLLSLPQFAAQYSPDSVIVLKRPYNTPPCTPILLYMLKA
eukprot:6190201-Pleurochrysis_carterae.AAC.1